MRCEKHQYRKGYARYLEGKRVRWDGENNVEHMWKYVKQAMDESAREVCDSVKVGGRNPKSVWWIDKVQSCSQRKKAV